VTTSAQVIQAPGTSSVSLSPLGGGGRGGGVGSGRGDGLGPGVGGGFGDGMFRPGAGVTWPTVVRDVKPTYTPEAMRLKLQGEVTLEVEILANGTVGNVRVKKSLDRTHGLDQEAMRVAKLWLFRPALDRQGKSVPVLAEIIISFNLH
jgi:TonB family protein